MRERPLDVLGGARQLLDAHRQAGQLGHLVVAEHRLSGPFAGDLLAARAATRSGHHPYLLLRRFPSDDGQVGLAHAVAIGRDDPADDPLAQAPGGFDEHQVTVAADRIDGEDHAGGVGGDQGLDDDRHGRAVAVQPAGATVVEGGGAVERGPAGEHRVEHGVESRHVQQGGVLAGERGAGAVLGGGGGADSDGSFAGALAQRGVGLSRRRAQLRRPAAGAQAGKEVGPLRRARRGGRQLTFQVIRAQESAKGVGRQHKAGGHGEAGAQQSPQPRRLPTHRRRVVGRLLQRMD